MVPVLALSATHYAIQMCGGSSAVARHFGIRPQAVSQWKQTGVPADRLVAFVKLAKSRKHGIRERDLRPELYGDVK